MAITIIQSISMIVVDALPGTVIISTSGVVSSVSASIFITVVADTVVFMVGIIVIVFIIILVVDIADVGFMVAPEDPPVPFIIFIVLLPATIGNSVNMLTQS